MITLKKRSERPARAIKKISRTAAAETADRELQSDKSAPFPSRTVKAACKAKTAGASKSQRLSALPDRTRASRPDAIATEQISTGKLSQRTGGIFKIGL